MKPNIKIIYVQTKKNKVFEDLDKLYVDKIRGFVDIHLAKIKAHSGDRKNRLQKKQIESQKILDHLDNKEDLILCDESANQQTSIDFSKDLSQRLSLNKKVCFVIGGAYGVNDDLKKRAQSHLNLSPFVLNHHIAKAVLLEQIYRALTLDKGIPYHNE